MLATQFSCHSLNEDGTIDHFEWIARQDNHDPSFECIEELYKVLGNDQGSIFIYSIYKNNVLKGVKIRMKEISKTTEKIEIIGYALKEGEILNVVEDSLTWVEELSTKKDEASNK